MAILVSTVLVLSCGQIHTEAHDYYIHATTGGVSNNNAYENMIDSVCGPVCYWVTMGSGPVGCIHELPNFTGNRKKLETLSVTKTLRCEKQCVELQTQLFLLNYFTTYTLDANTSILSVCLSVCLSITLVTSVKMSELIFRKEADFTSCYRYVMQCNIDLYSALS